MSRTPIAQPRKPLIKARAQATTRQPAATRKTAS